MHCSHYSSIARIVRILHQKRQFCTCNLQFLRDFRDFCTNSAHFCKPIFRVRPVPASGTRYRPIQPVSVRYWYRKKCFDTSTDTAHCTVLTCHVCVTKKSSSVSTAHNKQRSNTHLHLNVMLTGMHCSAPLRPGTVTSVMTPSSRHVLYYSFIHSRQAPLDDCLSQHLPHNSRLLDNAARMSNQQSAACVGQSLPLLLRLDLGPRPRMFDSPPITASPFW